MTLTTVRMARQDERDERYYEYQNATIVVEKVVLFHPIRIRTVRGTRDCTVVIVGYDKILVDQPYSNFRAKMSKLTRKAKDAEQKGTSEE